MIRPGAIAQIKSIEAAVLGAVMNGLPTDGTAGRVRAQQPMMVVSVVEITPAWHLTAIDCDWLVVVLVGARMGWLYDFEIAHAAT